MGTIHEQVNTISKPSFDNGSNGIDTNGGETMTLPTPSPHVPIEKSLEDLSVQATVVCEACSHFDKWETQGHLHSDEAIIAVTQAFRAIQDEVKYAYDKSRDPSDDSPMREIRSVSHILGQIAHHVGVLNRQLQGKN